VQEKRSIAERLTIRKRSSDVSDETAIGTFVNVYDGEVTVCIDYAYGGTTCFRLLYRGDSESWHLRISPPWDVYCYDRKGTCVPNGTLPCPGGNTFEVGA
jgi:hypothetical protein